MRQRRVRIGLAVAVTLFAVWWVWPLFGLLGKGAEVRALMRLAPEVLGLTGPKTFLVLVQNEDEMRPTGGYLTAAGTMTVSLGRVTGLELSDTFKVDDPDSDGVADAEVDDDPTTGETPPAPLGLYQAAPIWYFRDANWSPDFPTAAAVAERLFTAVQPATFDGVIALDQTALRFLLEATGPVHVSGLPGTVNADNVIAQMRAARDPAPGEGISYEWWLQRKDFIPNMAKAVFKQLVWTRLGSLLQGAIRVLDERHVTLWLRAADAEAVLAEHGWDGALRPGDADYVLVAEANLGFNKVNAVVQTQLRYQVDLASAATPSAQLTLTQTNPAEGALPCVPGPDYGTGTYLDLMTRCYWSYVRVVVPAAATLTAVTPHTTPGLWLMGGQADAGAITTQPEAHDTQSFGTLLVVPFNATLVTRFDYQLAPGALRPDGDAQVYRLRFQKQAGTLALPLTVAVRLPPGAQIVAAPEGGAFADGVWTYSTTLQYDVDVELRYR